MFVHCFVLFFVSFRFVLFCFSCLVWLNATRHSDFYFVITEWVCWLHLLQTTYCVTEVREKISLCLRLSTGMSQCSCGSQVYCVTLPSVHKHTCASWTRSCKLLLLLNKQKLWNCFIPASITHKCIPLPNIPSHLNAKWKAFKNLLSYETHLLCFYLFICCLFNCKYIRLYIVERLDVNDIWIGQDFEASDYALIWATILEFVWSGWENPRKICVPTAGVPANI